ncbi:PQQ-binding-like beta-propeller repeat protein [Streptomyces sp. NPDC050355]|uniref:outer membrane protein assembly factor BamB family protein n=1 Tax=Streptomyces sp. NPDC050355 TaxID=3365609 RepID=UPI0037BBB430
MDLPPEGRRATKAQTWHPSSTPTGCSNLATQDGAGLYALDAITGRKRWHTPLSGTYTGEITVSSGTASSGTVSSSTVYLPTHDGAVHALRTSDGEHRWTARPNGHMDMGEIADLTAPMRLGFLVLSSILPSTYDEDPDPPPSVLPQWPGQVAGELGGGRDGIDTAPCRGWRGLSRQ